MVASHHWLISQARELNVHPVTDNCSWRRPTFPVCAVSTLLPSAHPDRPYNHDLPVPKVTHPYRTGIAYVKTPAQRCIVDLLTGSSGLAFFTFTTLLYRNAYIVSAGKFCDSLADNRNKSLSKPGKLLVAQRNRQLLIRVCIRFANKLRNISCVKQRGAAGFHH